MNWFKKCQVNAAISKENISFVVEKYVEIFMSYLEKLQYKINFKEPLVYNIIDKEIDCSFYFSLSNGEKLLNRIIIEPIVNAEIYFKDKNKQYHSIIITLVGEIRSKKDLILIEEELQDALYEEMFHVIQFNEDRLIDFNDPFKESKNELETIKNIQDYLLNRNEMEAKIYTLIRNFRRKNKNFTVNDILTEIQKEIYIICKNMNISINNLNATSEHIKKEYYKYMLEKELI